MKDEFLFCPLGGSGEIGMNMNLFGYGQPGDHKWIMVDIGVTFALIEFLNNFEKPPVIIISNDFFVSFLIKFRILSINPA